jgi:hypothetical protein
MFTDSENLNSGFRSCEIVARGQAGVRSLKFVTSFNHPICILHFIAHSQVLWLCSSVLVFAD